MPYTIVAFSERPHCVDRFLNARTHFLQVSIQCTLVNSLKGAHHVSKELYIPWYPSLCQILLFLSCASPFLNPRRAVTCARISDSIILILAQYIICMFLYVTFMPLIYSCKSFHSMTLYLCHCVMYSSLFFFCVPSSVEENVRSLLL